MLKTKLFQIVMNLVVPVPLRVTRTNLVFTKTQDWEKLTLSVKLSNKNRSLNKSLNKFNSLKVTVNIWMRWCILCVKFFNILVFLKIMNSRASLRALFYNFWVKFVGLFVISVSKIIAIYSSWLSQYTLVMRHDFHLDKNYEINYIS